MKFPLLFCLLFLNRSTSAQEKNIIIYPGKFFLNLLDCPVQYAARMKVRCITLKTEVVYILIFVYGSLI